MFSEVLHPFASVTVIICVPGNRPLTEFEVEPLDHANE